MADQLPLMPKATAVWLVDNTTLTFRQIADFVGMHELEVAGIADGEVAEGIKGLDPIVNNQLDAEDIKRCEADPAARLRLRKRVLAPEPKRKGPRYTPVSKRQDRPAAIAWLVRYHPEMEDTQISKLIGTTKPTIQAIRTRTHWQSSSIQPVDPVALGLCTQVALDEAVRAAAEKKAKKQEAVPTSEERISLMPVQKSLGEQTRPAAPLPSNVEGFESFSLDDPRDRDEDENRRPVDPDSLFNLPREKKGQDED
ncbi:MAG TPA: cell cycle transcriptional regulator TrcR [Paracoccaceae bacterium]|nr:cell cycle transcriptional regulator TrcR [Paracoccaceae bacterium]